MKSFINIQRKELDAIRVLRIGVDVKIDALVDALRAVGTRHASLLASGVDSHRIDAVRLAENVHDIISMSICKDRSQIDGACIDLIAAMARCAGRRGHGR